MKGFDAVDCLFAFGYTIRKHNNGYQLCPLDVEEKDKKSTDLLLKELEENKDYYANIINKIGEVLL